MTLRQFKSKPETIPASTSWYLADLDEAVLGGEAQRDRAEVWGGT